MSRPIGAMLAQAHKRIRSLEASQRATLAQEQAQREREADFLMRMGLINEAVADGMWLGAELLPVHPSPHPSDEGLKPLKTSWPQPGQRVMPGGSHPVPVFHLKSRRIVR